MAQPVEIFGSVKGMTRDFGVDSLPDGFLWDVVDALSNRKGARVEQRGAWQYFPQATPVDFGGPVIAGAHVRFYKGTKLIVNANVQLWDVNTTTGAATMLTGGGHASMVQNAVLLRDRLYFFDDNEFPMRMVTWDGVSAPAVTALPGAPKAKVGIAYKDKLVVGGVPSNPAELYFSPAETEGGPPGTWDSVSHIGTSQAITGLAGMASQILVFHPGMIERIRGTAPPVTGDEGDMYVETLTDQIGCTMPQTIVPWRENILFADEHGVYLTDGATARNLIDLGGMGDFWRALWQSRVPTIPICSGVFLDYLLVTVNTLVGGVQIPFTLVCDLNERTWVRFSNYAAICYIPSTAETEESYCGRVGSNRLMRTSAMFQDTIPVPFPPPDYQDGNGNAVLCQLTTGFKRLAKEEGMQRVRNIFVSYQYHSYIREPAPAAIKVEYCLTPPRPEGTNLDGDLTWVEAGLLPDGKDYQRKKLPVGKRAYGVMVRLTGTMATRTTRFFSIGIETTSQDRAKVST